MRKRLYLSPANTDDCPCKDCKSDRYIGCHSECLKYIDWKQEHEAKLQQLQEQKSINTLLFDNQIKRNSKVSQEGGLHYGRRNNDTR